MTSLTMELGTFEIRTYIQGLKTVNSNRRVDHVLCVTLVDLSHHHYRLCDMSSQKTMLPLRDCESMQVGCGEGAASREVSE